MEKILVKYRSWYQGQPPKPIRLQIPGWSGEPNEHKEGDIPQPWHCVPFVEGSTYGLELLYSFNTECHVKMINNQVNFLGDFTIENKSFPSVLLPPFSSFAPGHFGMTSCLDIQVPDNYILRIEPHPKYYTDHTYTVPLVIPGHINTSMWPKIFFVVFKNPMPEQTYIFRKDEPYAQILILPRKVFYEINPMTSSEIFARVNAEESINKNCKEFVENNWHDHKGNNFDDKYKVLNKIYTRKGNDGVKQFLEKTNQKVYEKCKKITKKKIFFPKKAKNEII